MSRPIAFMLAAGAAAMLAACGGEVAAPTPESSTAPVAEDLVAEPMAEVATDPNQIGTASAEIGIQNGAPFFASAGEGFCVTGGGCSSGMVLDTGDIDLSGFPPGDVLVTITVNADAIRAGYSLPADGYDAVAIAVYSQRGPKPDPVFGASNWPAGFLAPVVSGDRHSVSFTDLESDQSVYEYSIAIDGPSGRIVLDPRIRNGGIGNK